MAVSVSGVRSRSPTSGSIPHVTEFLLRAKAEGYAVPEQALTRALDNLSNQVNYASDFSNGGEDIAYALYDLSCAPAVPPSGISATISRQALDAPSRPCPSPKPSSVPRSPCCGDRSRAAEAFIAAVADLDKREYRNDYRFDYGSRLRDTAAVLALSNT